MPQRSACQNKRTLMVMLWPSDVVFLECVYSLEKLQLQLGPWTHSENVAGICDIFLILSQPRGHSNARDIKNGNVVSIRTLSRKCVLTQTSAKTSPSLLSMTHCQIACFLWKILFILINLFFNWSIIALQNCIGFCQASTWISHRHTCVPSKGKILFLLRVCLGWIIIQVSRLNHKMLYYVKYM